MLDAGVTCVLMLGSDITVRRSVDATVGDGVDICRRASCLPVRPIWSPSA